MPIRGVSGLGNINSIPNYNKVEERCVFWRFRTEWGDVETSPGVYDWIPLESYIDTVVADGKFFSFQINVAPAEVTPTWLFSPPYNVPLCTADNGQTYPYYLNANFVARKNAMLDNLRDRIKNTWSTARKNKLVYWQSSEGKTGDEGTGIEKLISVSINGVDVPANQVASYQITSDQWTNNKRTTIWPAFSDDIAVDIPFCLFAVNPSNDATNWAWALANLPNVCLKIGQPSHNYNNAGELYYAERCKAITSVVPINMLFGEFERVDDLTWWQSAPKQNMFAELCSFMTHGTTSINISVSTFMNVIDVDDPDDWWMFEFANEVMGIRSTGEDNKAWIVFRDIIDGTNLARFPENVYGPVVPVSQYKRYNNKYLDIFNSSDSQERKNDRYVSLLLQYFNDARRTLIAPAVPNLNLEPLDPSNDHDAFNQDFIIYGFTGGNYGQYMTQYSPNTTSVGHARIGNPVTETHGRTGRSPNNEILVAIDSNLMLEASYTVDVDIYYYDQAGRSWSFNYYNASFLQKTAIEIVTNTGTNTWLKKSYTIPNMLGGGFLSNNTDYSLKTESGSATIFSMVYFNNITQNSNIIPIGGSKSNDLGDICGVLSEPFYTQGAFDIGKILYIDPLIATALTGFLYFKENNSGTLYNLNSSTGEVLSVQGTSCGVGTQGIYVLGNTLGIICGGDEVVLYTNGSFGVGKQLAYNSNLFTEVTGYTYVVDTATNIIYNLDTVTGIVGASTGSDCSGSGIAGTYRTGNNLTTICGGATTTLYTDGQFTSGSFLFTDINLLTPATGFDYIVTAINYIYSVDDTTGEVIAPIGICNGGVSGTFRRSNSQGTVCAASPTVTLYVVGEVLIGEFLYTDVNLTTPLTGYTFVVDTSTDSIYSVDTLTGEILSLVGNCNMGVATNVVLGNFLVDMCGGTPETVYSEQPFGIGAVLYEEASLTTLVQQFDFVRLVATGVIYNLNFNTAVVLSETGTVCGNGLLGSYKLGNNIFTICDATAVPLYTNGAFGTGKTLYEDEDLLVILSTPYAYVVDVSTGYIYNMYNSVVGSLTTGICGGGIVGSYRVSNSETAVCVSGTLVNIYSATAFAVGVFLFTDEDLLTPFTGYTYIVNPANDYIYMVDSATGEVLSQTNNACSASDYLQNLADDFTVEVAKYIVDDTECADGSCNCQ